MQLNAQLKVKLQSTPILKVKVKLQCTPISKVKVKLQCTLILKVKVKLQCTHIFNMWNGRVFRYRNYFLPVDITTLKL